MAHVDHNVAIDGSTVHIVRGPHRTCMLDPAIVSNGIGVKMGPVILVGHYDSPFVRRCAIAMHLLGIPFERNRLSGFADAEEMRKINPLGRMPSLILDDGEVIIDSAAILDHIAPSLMPEPGPARRRAWKVIALAIGIIDKAGAIVYERALRPPEKIHQPWIDRCRVQLDSGIAALEAMTPEGGFYGGGDHPMLADIQVGCTIFYLRLRLPESFPPGAYPRLERITAVLDAMPAFKATLPSPDELMPGKPL
jgi:glutathione S-transferase